MSDSLTFSTTRPLFGRVAVITGASRGIGAAIAISLAKAGAAVVINYLSNQARAEAVANSCRTYGSRAITVQADVTDFHAVERLIKTTANELGEPDILINNAGRARSALLLDTTEELWDELMDANLKAPFFCVKTVLPGMIKKHFGRIVNISSIWGISGGSYEVAYSASKGGLIALTKALAKELGPSGITVNAVAPGAIETDMLNDLTVDDLKQISEETPVGRLGTPEDVASVVLFLVSPGASFITGQIISPNGGLVI